MEMRPRSRSQPVTHHNPTQKIHESAIRYGLTFSIAVQQGKQDGPYAPLAAVKIAWSVMVGSVVVRILHGAKRKTASDSMCFYTLPKLRPRAEQTTGATQPLQQPFNNHKELARMYVVPWSRPLTAIVALLSRLALCCTSHSNSSRVLMIAKHQSAIGGYLRRY